METKKEAFKKFVIEQLKDFDYWREASPEGYAEIIVDEAVKLFCQPDVVGQSEQLDCVHPYSDVYQSDTECYCEKCGKDLTEAN